MKRFLVLILLFIYFQGKTQSILVRFDGLKAYFSPQIEKVDTLQRFGLHLDSISVTDEFIPLIVRLRINVYGKTQSGEFRNNVVFVFPSERQWDTLIRQKVVFFELQPEEFAVSVDTSFRMFSDMIDILLRKIDSFYNDDFGSYVKVHEQLVQLWKFSDKDLLALGKWKYAISQKYNELAEKLYSYGNEAGAIAMWYKAYGIDSQNSAVILNLAQFYLRNRDYNLAYRFIVDKEDIMTGRSFSEAGEIARKLFEFYYYRAKNEYDAGNVEQSFEDVSKADTLSIMYLFSEAYVDSLLQKLVRDRFFAVYDSLKKSVEKNDFGRSFQLFKTAYLFYSRYSSYLPRKLIVDLTDLFSDYLLQRSEHLRQVSQMDSILQILGGLQQFCQSRRRGFCKSGNERKINKLARNFYEFTLGMVGSSLKRQRLDSARSYLSKAKNIRQRYGLADSGKFVFYKRFLDSLMFMREVDTVWQMYRANELESAIMRIRNISGFRGQIMMDSLQKLSRIIARRYLFYLADSMKTLCELNTIQKLVLKYGLMGDSSLLGYLAGKLEQKFPQCVRSNYSFFRLFDSLRRMQEQKRFARMFVFIDSIKSLDSSQCFDMDTIAAIERKFKAPMLFQSDMQRFYQKLGKGEYVSALNALLQARQIYESHRLEVFGLQRPGIYELITGSNNLAFVRSSVLFLARSDSLELAYRLLEYMRVRGVRASKLKQLLKYVGYRLALYDFTLHRFSTTKKAIEYYANGHYFWYRYLIFAYIKQRKKMKQFKF